METGLEHDQEDDSSAPENTADSPFSCEEEEDYAPSPRKKRKVAHDKRVVTTPINGGGGGRGEMHPPQDNWSWRKYGQKPIKGSPYPRGYYRCSSSKGCPARKQVERSRLDPTTLLITYACDHNHPRPAAGTKNHNHRDRPSHPPSSITAKPAPSPNKECVAFVSHLDVEPAFAELAGELGWLCNIGSMVMDGTTLVGPDPCAYRELEAFLPIGEDDKQLFGDLGDLPESSMVLRQVAAPCWSGAM